MSTRDAHDRAAATIQHSYKLGHELYHRWYYDTEVWREVVYLGVPCWKSVSDLWSYQEILHELNPRLVVEFGTNQGGATLFFADVLARLREDGRVLSVDIDHDKVAPEVLDREDIELMTCSSADPAVAEKIQTLRSTDPSPIFAILDSDHSMEHVLAELRLLRGITRPGDYVICEDSNVNGHPVLPKHGPGPMEALIAYRQEHPGDYIEDSTREGKFGFTFAPRGFLIRA